MIKVKKVIVHSDLNHCYAQIEEMKNPSLRSIPMAVGGSEEKRNGIILAKNDLAKACGIKTGESLREAFRKCPSLLIIHPNYDDYIYYTEKVKDIYRKYTDEVESFGLDEAWFDLSHSQTLFGDGIELARKIQQEVYRTYGLKVSMGVSFNKIFAKLGSDLDKNMGFSIIDESNFKEVVWTLPVSDLLMVGRHTALKLEAMGIYTIKDLATYDGFKLTKRFGKIGGELWRFANGLDESPVKRVGHVREIKSVGNSKTLLHDIDSFIQLYEVFRVLSECIAARLREIHKQGYVVSIYLRGNDLSGMTRQIKMSRPTNLASDILKCAYRLARRHFDFDRPLRSVGIQLSQLVGEVYDPISLFENEESRPKQKALEETIEEVREMYGPQACQMASVLLHRELTDFDPKHTHTVHPIGFYCG